jgi:hypothetical protein
MDAGFILRIFFSRFSGCSFSLRGSFATWCLVDDDGAENQTMSEAWKLAEGETVVDCVVPSDDPWRIPVCTECGKVAYRVIVIAQAESWQRFVPLCGGHFTSACLQVPELNKFNRGGKIG